MSSTVKVILQLRGGRKVLKTGRPREYSMSTYSNFVYDDLVSNGFVNNMMIQGEDRAWTSLWVKQKAGV